MIGSAPACSSFLRSRYMVESTVRAARAGGWVVAPDVAGELVAAEGLVRLADERLQQVELQPGELKRLVVDARARLLDHAAEMRDALDELLEDEQVTVEVSEDALAGAARVWLGRSQVE